MVQYPTPLFILIKNFRDCLDYSIADLLNLHVLIPSAEYSGHQPFSPVAKGITPSKNQRLLGPQNARLISDMPSTILKTRSIGCIFSFMLISFTPFL